MKKQSLTTRTVRTTMVSCLLLGVIALVIGLIVYTTTMIRQNVRHAFETASHARMSATHGVDSIPLAKEVMGIYRSLTPQQRELMHADPEAYRAFYSSIDTAKGEGGTWDVLINLLDTFVIDLDDVYLGMYDEETNALVYIANADDEIIMYPGDWETVSEHEVRKFLSWDGEGMLYEISHTEDYGWLCTAGYPIKERPSGELREFLLVDVEINDIIRSVADFAAKVGLGVLIVTVLMVLFIRRRIRKTVAEPIDAIADAALAYVKGKKEGAEGAEYFSGLNIKTGDELENLSRVMADMERDLAQHEDHIRAITAEKEKINTELNMAAQIQESMLPHVFPAFPGRRDFDVFASMDPAKEVGGDFYDYFLIDDDHLCLVIADVSGKGVPAALFMMASKIILQSVAMLGSSPREILSKTNQAICSSNEAEMFVTVWLGILELSTGKLTAANAGHEYPVLKKPGGPFELFRDMHDFVLGGFDDSTYEEYELALEPGTKLFVYTDGVAEAMNSAREQFGTERMLDALNASPEASPEDMLKNVRAAVNRFVENEEQFDDLTMLGFEYIGPAAAKEEGTGENRA